MFIAVIGGYLLILLAIIHSRDVKLRDICFSTNLCNGHKRENEGAGRGVDRAFHVRWEGSCLKFSFPW